MGFVSDIVGGIGDAIGSVAKVVSPIASGLGAISPVISGISAIAGAFGSEDNGSGGGGVASGSSAADPFAPWRRGYANQLAEIMNNPKGTLPYLPGYQAGLDAIQRSSAAIGHLGSGNLAIALQKYGGDVYAKQVDILSNLAGAYSGSPATAGQLQQQGQVNRTNLIGQGLNSISGGLTRYGQQSTTTYNNPGGIGGGSFNSGNTYIGGFDPGFQYTAPSSTKYIGGFNPGFTD